MEKFRATGFSWTTGAGIVRAGLQPHCRRRDPDRRESRSDGSARLHHAAVRRAIRQHLDVHAYRTVHDGACYAIDLLVFGVNPAVYDPPATPPFSDTHAFAAMRDVLQSLEFMETADQATANASTVSR